MLEVDAAHVEEGIRDHDGFDEPTLPHEVEARSQR